MSHVLIISPERVGERMAGIGIRLWELAGVLSGRHEVTMASPEAIPRAFARAPFRLVQYQGNLFAPILKNVDIVLLQGHLSNDFFDQCLDVPTVVDLYDPFLVENMTYSLTQGDDIFRYDLKTILRQLAAGDFFLCANEEQRFFYLGMLAAAGRMNPVFYREDKSFSNLIAILPYGVPSREPVHQKPVMRGVIEGIGAEDKIIFFGGIYDWYDPFLLLDSLKIVEKGEKDFRVIFIANPNQEKTPQDLYHRVKERCKAGGWLDKKIFFLDWIPYELRDTYYLEADLAVCTHGGGMETDLSYRTRLFDFLWAGMPLIVSRGGAAPEMLIRQGAALGIQAGDSRGLASLILRLFRDKAYALKLGSAGRAFVSAHYAWEKIADPLLRFCDRPRRAPDLASGFRIGESASFKKKFKKWLGKPEQV